MNLTELLTMARRYWVDDDHVWRYDVDNPGPDDEPRAVARLGDGWMLSDALEVMVTDDGTACACESCADEREEEFL